MTTSLMKTALVGMLVILGALTSLAAPVKHPNLLLNPDEIAQVKRKIAKYPWAAAALQKTKEHALGAHEWDNGYLNQALYHAFTGDKSFADRARGYLLNQ